MKSLDEITVFASLLCAETRQSVDVYKKPYGYGYALTETRKTNKHEKRLTYEKGKVVVKDASGKVIRPSRKVEEEKAPAAKSKKPESSERSGLSSGVEVLQGTGDDGLQVSD